MVWDRAKYYRIVELSREMPFYAAFDADKARGFVAIKIHNNYTSEVCVMGFKDYHRKGIGRSLINKCEQFCLENNMNFLTVKTLDESREQEL